MQREIHFSTYQNATQGYLAHTAQNLPWHSRIQVPYNWSIRCSMTCWLPTPDLTSTSLTHLLSFSPSHALFQPQWPASYFDILLKKIYFLKFYFSITIHTQYYFVLVSSVFSDILLHLQFLLSGRLFRCLVSSPPPSSCSNVLRPLLIAL